MSPLAGQRKPLRFCRGRIASQVCRVRKALHAAAGTNPEEVHFAALSLLAGTALLVTGRPPAAFGKLFPQWAALGYCFGLIVAALAILIGVLAHRPRAELGGLILMGFTACAYGVAALAVNGLGALIGGCFLIGYGTSQLRRARMIVEATQRLHEVESAAHVRASDLQ